MRMADTHFVWWSSDGARHEGPIRYFRLPDRAVLVPHGSCRPYRNEDKQPLRHEPSVDPRPPVTELLGK